MKDAELMGARAAVIVGRGFEERKQIDLRLLHGSLIRSVLNDTSNEEIGEIHSALREKVKTFDSDGLEQMGFDLRNKQAARDPHEGFTVQTDFATLYIHLIRLLSYVKTYSSKPVELSFPVCSSVQQTHQYARAPEPASFTTSTSQLFSRPNRSSHSF